MSVLVCDSMSVKDCESCRGSQAQFGALCALCHFTNVTNTRLEKIILEEQNEMTMRFWRRFLIWGLTSAILFALIFLISLWK